MKYNEPQCGGGWVPVGSLVFKTSVGRDECLRWVRLPYAPANPLAVFASYFITVRFFCPILGQCPGLDVNADVKSLS